LSRAIPDAAADRPVNAFSSEITTGMSAPPMGSTIRFPSRAAKTRIPRNTSWDRLPAATSTAQVTAPISSARLMKACPGSMIGRPGSSSCSLPNAMLEPQKETDPTIAENTSGTTTSVGRSPPKRRNSARAISATAPPPTPLNSATIWGIAVIFTDRAAGTPIVVPIATPSAIRPQSPTLSISRVATTAIAIPTAATALPRRALRGWLSRCSP
jgi:hypothetical protein